MASFEIDVKVTNTRGAWAVLRTAPNRFNYLATVYYVECYAPDFAERKTSSETGHNQYRAKTEASMRRWLATR
jgi:hypothetical protein